MLGTESPINPGHSSV